MAAQTVMGSSISPTLGNGIAYFALWWLADRHGVTFQDPEMALLFAGGIVGSLLLEVRRMGGGIISAFKYFFPPKTGK